MRAGDEVTTGWAYAVLPTRVINAAWFQPRGSRARIVRVVDANAVVVEYRCGMHAVVHPSSIQEVQS